MPPQDTLNPAAPAPTPEPAPPVEQAPAAPPAPAPENQPPEEKFLDLDDSSLAAVSPEIRQSFLNQAETKARERINKEREAAAPHKAKAEALEKLVADPRFQKWYYEQQNPQPPKAPEGPAKPAISQEEWQAAYEKASQGDLSALNGLQEKQLDLLVKQKYAPIIEHVQGKQRELEMTMELNDLFSNHADAKELDSIRVNPADPKSASLLEMALHYVSDKGGRSFEEAYQAARKMADQMKTQAKNVALGLVQDKKGSTTEPPNRTSTTTENVVEVATPQEALRNQIMASLRGTNVTYRVRPRTK